MKFKAMLLGLSVITALPAFAQKPVYLDTGKPIDVYKRQEQGVLDISYYKRYNFRVNLENQVRKWLTVSANIDVYKRQGYGWPTPVLRQHILRRDDKGNPMDVVRWRG